MDYIKCATSRIQEAITPVISDYVYEMYRNPMNFIDATKPGSLPTPSLLNFQTALKRVPNLTNSQVTTFLGEVEKNCPYFKSLKDSLFVAYVKMISNAVKMKGSDSQRIDVEPPKSEDFIHSCFTVTAHNFYENPYIMKETDETKRDAEMDSRIRFCIEKAIANMIPMQKILDSYMNISKQMDETDIGQLASNEDVQDLLPNPEQPIESTKEDVHTESPITESPFPTKEPNAEPDVLFPDAPQKAPEKIKQV
jgi:hypothetical protein